MDIVEINVYTLRNLNKINIVLGKNGCGKSTMLRQLEQGLISQHQVFGKSKYITPESLARGSFSDKGFECNLEIMRKAHGLLADIVDLEFNSKL